MKTSIYTYLCLLLMAISCTPALAARWYNYTDHILRVGLAGGGTHHLTPNECQMKSKIGATGAIAVDYAFYKSLRKIDLGLRTGIDLGYLYAPYKSDFQHQFTNQDYLGNHMDYSTSGTVEIAHQQLFASIPLMFALRSNGFVWNIGARVQSTVYQSGKQQLSNPTITAHYSAYGVSITNELITGLVAEEQLSTILDFPTIGIECMAATEIGYEYAFKHGNAIGVMAYFQTGVWGTRAEMTHTPIINVAPIADSNNPVPAVTINDAYHSLLTSYTPMQFGMKLYYAFNLQ